MAGTDKCDETAKRARNKMCGIAGLYAPHKLPDIVRDICEMTVLLKHRGPDRGGFWIDPSERLAIGHRRLSIMDPLPRSDQPMKSSSARYMLVFNGEIYNCAAIRAQLAAAGRSMVTDSDTEVLLEAIDAFGLDATLDKIEGMFALAVWDIASQQLTLCRDRFGMKPCYWTWRGGVFAFASELKALVRRRGPAFTSNPSAIRNLLDFGYVASPETALSEILQLEPGEILTMSDGGPPKLRRYWRLEDVKARQAGANAAKSR
jgi:asparagine synthase (glutamine-hydrolysing)